VLFLVYWTNILNHKDTTYYNRTLSQNIINKAITIMVSGFIIWLIALLMLEITQVIPARDLIFEATSAMGTVGLSTGATGQLDEIGKIITMLAMFAGRVGPMTLFMFLSSTRTKDKDYPESGITLA
jgi:trk system potassium uptake protein TrkH